MVVEKESKEVPGTLEPCDGCSILPEDGGTYIDKFHIDFFLNLNDTKLMTKKIK